mgnify:CR=1 FL=1
MTASSDRRLDIVFVNPGGRERIYQELGGEWTAIEPPLWCRLIAGYAPPLVHAEIYLIQAPRP